MSLQLQSAKFTQIDEIARLLCGAFGASPNPHFADRRLLEWKYFDTNGAHSYLLRDAQSLAAHCGAAAVQLILPDQERVSGVCFMDWASARHSPFAGLLLKKQLLSTVEVAVVTGGTAATRALIPRLGFTDYTTLDTFACVIRPLRQWRTRPDVRWWKDSARFLRNTAWSLRSPGPSPAEWSAVPVNHFDRATELRSYAFTTPEHNPALLNYWMRCPSAQVEGFEIQKRGDRLGHFLIGRIAGQTRILDVRLPSDDVDDWRMAYRLATATAACNKDICEIVALASTPLVRTALTACGFRWRDSAPLSVYDPLRRLAGALPLLWSFIDNDAAYLYDPAHPYIT